MVNPSRDRNTEAMIVGGRKNTVWAIIANPKPASLETPNISRTCNIAKSNVPVSDGTAGTSVAKNIVPMMTSVAVISEMSRLTARAIIQAAAMPTRSQ